MVFIYKKPFFEQDKGKAPQDIQVVLECHAHAQKWRVRNEGNPKDAVYAIHWPGDDRPKVGMIQTYLI